MPVHKPIVAILLALSLAFAVCCGSSSSNSSTSSTSTVHFAKTKFVLHAGLAFGAFHRYIYKPWKEGKFSGGIFHHKLATLKAALAAAFAYHELKLALDDARSSKILSTLLSPILALQTKLTALKSSLEGGNVDAAAIQSANNSTSAIGAESSRRGQPIQDQPTPSLGG